jgi:Uma2 family endonuclease
MVPTVPMRARMMAHARHEFIGRHRMHMALKTHHWTRADLTRLPDDGNRYEIVQGELLVSPAPLPAHIYVQDALQRLLTTYCEALGLAVSSSGGAFVADDSETIPDTIVRKRQMPPPVGWEDAAVPVLVVEVLSDSTRRNDEVKKRAFYMKSGVPEYWIIDAEARTFRVITLHSDRIERDLFRWLPAGAPRALEFDIKDFFVGAIG